MGVYFAGDVDFASDLGVLLGVGRKGVAGSIVRSFEAICALFGCLGALCGRGRGPGVVEVTRNVFGVQGAQIDFGGRRVLSHEGHPQSLCVSARAHYAYCLRCWVPRHSLGVHVSPWGAWTWLWGDMGVCLVAGADLEHKHVRKTG